MLDVERWMFGIWAAQHPNPTQTKLRSSAEFPPQISLETRVRRRGELPLRAVRSATKELVSPFEAFELVRAGGLAFDHGLKFRFTGRAGE